ncbi:Mu-like prophage protein gp29 [Marinibacterium anthonyi]|nr:Mu-like prophage protein gp29 [Marinibacterium anthonyi]
MATAQLVDQWGRPVRRAELRREIAAPTIGGVRSPITGYPGDGLNPERLAVILREADAGDPIRYLELAETIEERDLHYVGVLGTRKRSVSQIEITVEEGGESQHDLDMAEMVRDWLMRDELSDETFDILDAMGKGYSLTEILWETSSLQWQPARLEYRDPRWFRFDRRDLATPMMLDEGGAEIPLPAYKFIFARIRAKSGLALRSGLARLATWNWMFKAYTQRDWAIFTQTYGQPIRVGKYGPGADEKDRDTLFRAVANIGGDCAAIIPESMLIEFVEAKNVGSSTDHYERRSDWLDKQISKAVLGQTATTDAETGGLGSGKEHREVQKDIEAADCKALAAILNRDLVRPWIDLEYGPQEAYPRIVIQRQEPEDLKAFSDAIGPMIDRGLRVAASDVLDKFGLPEAAKDAEILRPTGQNGPQTQVQPPDGNAMPPESSIKHPFNTHLGSPGTDAALHTDGPSAGRSEPLAPAVDRLAKEAAPQIGQMLDQIEVMLEVAGSLEEAREMMLAAWPTLGTEGLARVLGEAFLAAHAGGRAMIQEETDG